MTFLDGDVEKFRCDDCLEVFKETQYAGTVDGIGGVCEECWTWHTLTKPTLFLNKIIRRNEQLLKNP